MRRKRIKKIYASSLDFNYNSYAKAKICIKSFLVTILTQIGLKRYKDYIVSRNFLVIRHLKGTTGQITVLLREVFPLFNYYWETPRVLVWF